MRPWMEKMRLQGDWRTISPEKQIEVGVREKEVEVHWVLVMMVM